MSGQKAKLNILYLGRYSFRETLSGPEKTAKRIFNEYCKRDKTYFIQYFFDGRKFGINKKLFGLTEESESSIIYTAGIFKVYSLLRKIKPDIIHIITFERFAVIALVYKFFNNVKIVYNEHGVIAYENSELKNVSFWHRFKDKFCEKRLLGSSDKIIFVSEQAMDTAEKYYRLDETKCVILANGVDEVFNNKNPKDFTQPLRAVLKCNNELHKSGFEFLAEYVKHFKPEIEIYLISTMKLDVPGIKVVPPMDTQLLAEFYRDKHIYLSLNKYDTFSIAAAEAMAAGLVPVITQETGISRYIENGFNGYVVPFGKTEQLSGAVNQFISLSAEDKQTVSRNARDIFESLSWQNVFSTYQNIYNGLV